MHAETAPSSRVAIGHSDAPRQEQPAAHRGWYTFCQIIGVLWIVISGLLAVALVSLGQEKIEMVDAPVLYYAIIALCVLQVVAGLGIAMSKRWGRILGYPCAVIGLFNPPIGTVVSILMLIALTKAGNRFT